MCSTGLQELTQWDIKIHCMEAMTAINLYLPNMTTPKLQGPDQLRKGTDVHVSHLYQNLSSNDPCANSPKTPLSY